MYFVQVNIEDLSSFDNALAKKICEEATTEVADKVTNLHPDGEEEIQDIKVRFSIVNIHNTKLAEFFDFWLFCDWYGQ